jgi:hypothetical protein
MNETYRSGTKVGLFIVSIVLVATCSRVLTAQDLYIYPQKGQSADQQGRDRYECHTWAVQQTGFDPTRAQSGAATSTSMPPPPQPEAPQGGLGRGALRGAAVGAVGGAIAGDAGKGAAIGAGSGALIGGMRRRDQQAREQQAQQNYQNQRATQQTQASSQHGAYNRAMTACLQGRGYSVN